MVLTNEQIFRLIDRARKYRSETNNIEFKDARGGLPGDLWRTISSFSHKPNGGIIVFGIKEDREKGKIDVVGGLNVAFLQEKIVSYLRELMENHGFHDIRPLEYEGQIVLALFIQEIPPEKKPCFNKHLGLPNGACVREGNTDRVITGEEMRNFIRNSAVFKYDKTCANGVEISILDENKIKIFLEKSALKVDRTGVNNAPTEEVMRNLGIVDKYEEGYLPTFAGFMIFSKTSPQQFLSFSRYIIRCVRYQSDSVASPIIDKMDIDGTLDQQIDSVHKFILRNIPLKALIVRTKRVETYGYPEDAIRELVANAVIHRDYMISETYTQVSVFSNRVEISNPGNLPPGVTIENIKDAQFSRNQVIAGILKDMDYLEEYGRGIDIVFSRMEERGFLPPIFKNLSNSFKVILFGETFKDLNERQIQIWNRLQEERRLTSKKCREMLPGVSRATIGNDLKGLVDIGLIVPKGSSNNTYYEPRY